MVSCPRNHLYRTPVRSRNSRPFGGGFFVGGRGVGEVDHVGDLAHELDLEAILRGDDIDDLDEAVKDLRGLHAGGRLVQGLVEPFDFVAI